MNHLTNYICHVQTSWSKNVPLIISIIAAGVSLIALAVNIRFARRNIRLAMQQALFRIVSDKAKDCNTVWKNEPNQNQNDPHTLVMTELVITTEILERSFEMFRRHWPSITEIKDDYYYLFYKQFIPDLRGWLQNTLQIANTVESNGGTYTNQVANVMSKLQKHFEQ